MELKRATTLAMIGMSLNLAANFLKWIQKVSRKTFHNNRGHKIKKSADEVAPAMTSDPLLSRLEELEVKLTGPSLDYLGSDEWSEDQTQYSSCLSEYAELVPLHTVSRCPICNEVLEYAMDLRGIQYPWWWEHFPFEFSKPRACQHFMLLQGALNLNGRDPTEVQTWHTRPGPSQPFVIERLAQIPSVSVVINEISVGENDQGFVIAYFSEKPFNQTDLHQNWLRDRWTIYDEDGEPITSRSQRDKWSFDLGSIAKDRRLFLIEKNDLSLRPFNESELPSLAMADENTLPQLISKGKLTHYAAPRGQDVDDYRPHTGWD